MKQICLYLNDEGFVGCDVRSSLYDQIEKLQTRTELWRAGFLEHSVDETKFIYKTVNRITGAHTSVFKQYNVQTIMTNSDWEEATENLFIDFTFSKL